MAEKLPPKGKEIDESNEIDRMDEIMETLASDKPLPAARKGNLKDFESWDPDKLEEEFKKHPFFMTELPKEGEAMPPLIEAFQQLKYSPDDNTPDDLALNYKEDGLFHFKLKKYRIATTCFSEGIRYAESELNENPDVCFTSQLYNNRAASQFHIGNHRSALKDCDKALALNPNYIKPLMRALDCCVKLEKWKMALEYCEMGDKIIPNNAEVAKIREMAKYKQRILDIQGRRSEGKKKEEDMSKLFMLKMLRDRSIKVTNENFLNDAAAESGKKVHIGADGKLEWPVLFYYPQYSQSDFIENFHEDSRFIDHLIELLDNDRPGWDRDNEYHSDSVDCYFVDTTTGAYLKFDMENTIAEILSNANYYLPTNGVPGFFLMARDNEMCKVLLERCQ